MAHPSEHAIREDGSRTVAAVFSDPAAADAAVEALQSAGINRNTIHHARSSTDHAALGHLPHDGRRAAAAALGAGGAVVIVASNSASDHDKAMALLEPLAANGLTDAAGDGRPLPDGVRGTTRDTPYTTPQDEHAGHGSEFPDKLGDGPGRPDKSPQVSLYVGGTNG